MAHKGHQSSSKHITVSQFKILFTHKRLLIALMPELGSGNVALLRIAEVL